jgi:hypothetical protein
VGHAEGGEASPEGDEASPVIGVEGGGEIGGDGGGEIGGDVGSRSVGLLHCEQSEVITGNQRSSRAIRGHQGQSEVYSTATTGDFNDERNQCPSRAETHSDALRRTQMQSLACEHRSVRW